MPTQNPTLEALQKIGENFHELADEVLKHNYVRLRSLESPGRNAEGKPVKGTPDSYVGASPETCSIAIEHTTYAIEKLKRKFLQDFNKVIEKCPYVQEVIFCTNRSKDDGIAKAIINKAEEAGKSALIVWGEEIASVLDGPRQDLRRDYLDIPLCRLTQHSVRPALEVRVQRIISKHLSPEDIKPIDNRLRRPALEGQFHRLRLRRGITLVTGDAGLGKTIWSASEAIATASVTPTIWIPARLMTASNLSSDIVEFAYGVDDASKIAELISLVRSLGHPLVVFIDGIDECKDYEEFAVRLKQFITRSTLSDYTHCVMTCRTEAIKLFTAIDPGIFPSCHARNGQLSRRLALVPLSEQESTNFLRRMGADTNDTANIRNTLPTQFWGNPLYLSLSWRLQQSGKLTAGAKSWIDLFARYFETDIGKRLRSNGSFPPQDSIRAALGLLALAELRDPAGAKPDQVDHELLKPIREGENTFLQRAIQSGLLISDVGRVRFFHALLREYFAASHVAGNRALSLHDKVQTLATLPGRSSLLEVATQLEPKLLAEIIRTQPALVPSFEPHWLDDETTTHLIQQASCLLNRDFPSARQAAAQVLGTIGNTKCIETIKDWHDGAVRARTDPRTRTAFTGVIEVAAEFFLRVEHHDSLSTIVQHRNFSFSHSEGAYYFLEFANRIKRISSEFQKRLADYAFEELSRLNDELSAGSNLVMVLAYLGDGRLVDLLTKVVAKRALAPHEHRALIHLNTDPAMSCYLKSLNRYHEAMATIECQSDIDDDEKRRRRSALWYPSIPFDGGIRDFPHDALLALVRKQLRNPSDETLSYGLAVAQFFPHSDLVDDYGAALERHKERGYAPMYDRMIFELVEGMRSEDIVALYRNSKSNTARWHILCAAGKVGGRQVEQMMLDALDDDSVAEAACVGLTDLRSHRAGPTLQAGLHTVEGWGRRIRIKALGRIRYEAALDDLLRLLDEIPVDVSSSNDEYELIRAIGLIGGRKAFEHLVRRCLEQPNCTVLEVLLDSPDPAALEYVHQSLQQNPALKGSLGKAIAGPGRLTLHSEVHTFSDMENAKVEFCDDELLRFVIESALHRIELEPDVPEGWRNALEWRNALFYDCKAIGHFDSPLAEGFLRDLAEKHPDDDREGLSRAVKWARRWLADRGDRRWMQVVVGLELDRYAPRNDNPPYFLFSDRTIEELQVWPRDILREELLTRATTRPDVWLYAFASFAAEQDQAFIEAKAQSLDAALADKILNMIGG